MAGNDVIIELVDRQKIVAETSADYQPFGIKVLKLRVRLRSGVDPKEVGFVWIHPVNYRRPDGKSKDPADWRVFGTADDDPHLWVAWGAGDEKGFCASTKDRFKFIKAAELLETDAEYYIYLHLIHRPADPFHHIPTEKTLTIIATTEQKKDRLVVDDRGRPIPSGSLVVKLTVPQGLSNPLRARWRWEQGHKRSVITLAGAPGQPAQLPRYVARWWPSRQVVYQEMDGETAAFIKQIRLEYDRQGGDDDHSKLSIYHGNRPLAHFEGDIRLPLHDLRLCSFEAFRFPDDYHLVLRLWFYWIHLDFDETQLLTFVPEGQRDAWEPEAGRVRASIQGGLLDKPWRTREEVPDIERFDLILTPDWLDYKFVGTDVHWQEYWSQIAKKDDQWGDPLRAGIATLVNIPKLVAKGRKVPHVEPPPFDPLANGLCDLVNENTGCDCPHRPQGALKTPQQRKAGIETEVCPGCGSHFGDEQERALGSFTGKHGPIMHNVDIMENAVSTDVLKG